MLGHARDAARPGPAPEAAPGTQTSPLAVSLNRAPHVQMLARVGAALNARTVQRAAAQRQAVVQRVVSPALRHMKQSYDMIQARTPANHAARLAIVADVPALAGAAATWTQRRNAAQQLWGHWHAAYAAEAAGQQPLIPQGRDANIDSAAMTANYIAFRAVSEHLIDHGLVHAKQQLAVAHYLTNAPPNAELENDDETWAQFKARLAARARAIVIPGANAWYAKAGYAFNAQGASVTALAPLHNVAIHWTVHSDQIHGAAALRTSAAINAIVTVLVPNGNGLFGVHVTLEVHGGDNPLNPRAYGRPAARHNHVAQLPHGTTTHDLDGRLNAANTDVEHALETYANQQNAKVRPTWETH